MMVFTHLIWHLSVPMENPEERKRRIIDDWRPIRASPRTRWWYSTFHNITVMVGAGVLALPHAMAKLGWGPGFTLLVLSWIITFYTMWQMVDMHEMEHGQRHNRYHELGQNVFGKRLGLAIVVPQQLIVLVGVDIVYLITGGKSLKKFSETVLGERVEFRSLTKYILIFATVPFLISHILPNFHSISWVSFPAAIMSVSYSTIIWTTSLRSWKLKEKPVDKPANTSTIDAVFEFFSAMGVIAFAYAAHNITLEIQATIPSTPARPSRGPMWRGSVVAYIIVAYCYFPVAFFGYRAFGNAVKEDVLISLQNPEWLIALANLLVAIHLVGSYQIFAMPVFDMMETLILNHLIEARANYDDEQDDIARPAQADAEVEESRILRIYHLISHILYKVSRVGENEDDAHRLPPPPSFFIYRFIARTLYVAFTVLVATMFPFFGGLMGFFGGFALTPNSYFLPNIMWLMKGRQPRWKIINWICIVLGVLLMFLAASGGLYKIVTHIQMYQLFTPEVDT